MRLQDKIAIVIGAGQGPGEGMGNGRATALRFAQEGGTVLCVEKYDVTAILDLMEAEGATRLARAR